MDFQSIMETFAEAWVAANTSTPLTEAVGAANNDQNLLLGLGVPGSAGSSATFESSESLARPGLLSASSTSPNQLNLSGGNTGAGAQGADKNDEDLFPSALATSTLLDLKDSISGNNGRNTIPIHCIIERSSLFVETSSRAETSGPQKPSTPTVGSNNSSGDLGTDLVGQTLSGHTNTTTANNSNHHNHHQHLGGENGGGGGGGNSSSGNSSIVIEQDTYAILPSTIPFTAVVKSVLAKLGYAAQETVGAKAFIQLRNWKLLSIEHICDSIEPTLGDIFGDIASFITLRIRLFRPRMSAAHELKDKLLQVLLAHSYNLIANPNSSIDQQLLSSLVRAGNAGSNARADLSQELSEDARHRLDQWYLQQILMQYRQLATMSNQPAFQAAVPPAVAAAAAAAAAGMRNDSASSTPSLSHFMGLNGNDPLAAAAVAGMHSSLSGSRSSSNGNLTPNNNNNGGGGNNNNTLASAEKHFGPKHSNNTGGHHHSTASSGHHSLPNSRTRIRTSFDPEMELPKLHKWFGENRHPSRSQVQEYVKELNALESRRGRKPLDVNNVVYWFKNARAAHKRAELKFVTSDSSNAGGNGGSGVGHNAFSAFGQALGSDFFGLNGHSPGKNEIKGAGSDDHALSNASRNGSNMDEYYSFEDDMDSREEAQTLDLSMRNNLDSLQSRMFFVSPRSLVDVKLEEVDDEDDETELKIIEPEERCEQLSSPENGQDDLKHHDQNEGSSECNSIDEESDDETSMMDRHAASIMPCALGSAHDTSVPASATHPDSPESRRTRRSRTFIDPMSEVPRLESWFQGNTHPAHSQIVRFTEELNKMPYRQKFPKLEPKNIQFWFKNRRAKIKRTSGLVPALTGSAAGSSTTTTTTAASSLHNSSALNIERLINAH